MLSSPASADAARRYLGLLSIGETAALADRGVVIPDPSSTLVSPGVEFGSGVVLWPGTTLHLSDRGALAVGAGTILFTGTRIVAAGGRSRLGHVHESGGEGGGTL